MMRHTLLVALIALSTFAQGQGRIPRIGYLSAVSVTDPAARAQYEAFAERLRELGYVEGKTVTIERLHAEGRFDNLPMLAGELAKSQVDVIVTAGTPAITAARRATASIPIVAASIDDPVGSGFARSLEKPGGNVTGFATMGSMVLEKRLELLLEAVPGAKRIGLLAKADDAFFVRVLPGLQAAAQKRGSDISIVYASNAKSLQDAFGNLASRHVSGVLVAEDAFLDAQAAAIAALALKYKLPTVFPALRAVEDGGLLGYANDPKYRYQSAAVYVDRILKGAKPAEMPIEQPIKFALAVNQKTAAAIGITLPGSIVARAGKVIN